MNLISPLKHHENCGNIKNTFITYELKKTKHIKKTSDSISIHSKCKAKLSIHEKITKEHESDKKLLLITFGNEILQFIKA